jgi:hypothetical protein
MQVQSKVPEKYFTLVVIRRPNTLNITVLVDLETQQC